MPLWNDANISGPLGRRLLRRFEFTSQPTLTQLRSPVSLCCPAESKRALYKETGFYYCLSANERMIRADHNLARLISVPARKSLQAGTQCFCCKGRVTRSTCSVCCIPDSALFPGLAVLPQQITMQWASRAAGAQPQGM